MPSETTFEAVAAARSPPSSPAAGDAAAPAAIAAAPPAARLGLRGAADGLEEGCYPAGRRPRSTRLLGGNGVPFLEPRRRRLAAARTSAAGGNAALGRKVPRLVALEAGLRLAGGCLRSIHAPSLLVSAVACVPELPRVVNVLRAGVSERS